MPMLKETMLKRLLLPIAAAGGGGSAPVQDTATGNPLVFFTDLARPLKSLLVPFSPQQEGSGDPSPQNVRSIVPWNGLTVFGGGKNLFNGQYIKGVVTGNATQGYVLNTVTNANSAVIQCKGNTTYTVKKHSQSNRFSIATSEVEPENNTPLQLIIENQNLTEYTFTTSAKALYIIVYVSTGTEQATPELQCEVGQTATAYEPYKPITETDIVFPSPVYGGEHEAVSGVLQERQYDSVTFKWGDATNRTVIGNVERRGFIVPRQVKSQDDLNEDPTARFCSVAPWKYNYSSDDVHYYGGGYSFYVFLPVGTDEDLEFQLVVERPLPPQEQTLTGHQITALIGDNTIWSDANGEMTATYLKKA